ncbi:fructose-bisphosphate aldolase [Candidatus Woesearchaeota archaeon CG08_land_8_20_14_0_20_47_9]|nr:MAG: hypothetical protein AUJ69_04180 [Candidatus Woesearchaeota archaeon CG1_02_47_18]PIO04359.1 MAG: fructose-bisphosphate aldolase [Candidatus Woesearchaeota archaeon CG08_land_8_20_14_0_20_47_9]HII29843.1 fructose-bisphosphate aldolase [Candidatus Woesearchaeota archaeon]
MNAYYRALRRLFVNGRSLMLAYDQGLEHGPSVFNAANIDPNYILNIAFEGRYNAVILHHGIAEKYFRASKCYGGVPLVIKLNGKTNIAKTEPYAAQVCSVERALRLGAAAVGYTIYVGSRLEAEMLREFSQIVEKAHRSDVPVIAWVYPRGHDVRNELESHLLAHAARLGLELGADIIKIRYPNDVEDFKWVVKSAGLVKVLVAGGDKQDDAAFLSKVHGFMSAGASGMAVGRNVWQHNQPLKMTKAIKRIIFENAGVKDALGEMG